MESDRDGGYRGGSHAQSGYHSEGGNGPGYRSDTGYHSDQGTRFRSEVADYKRDRAGFSSRPKQVDIAGHSALNNNLPLHNPAGVHSASHDVHNPVAGVRTSSHDVEVARQRALQAADYYHRTVMGSSDDPDTSPNKDDPYFTQFNGGSDPLRAGVTPASSDAYYKAKLRAGFIDLRNSYNEKHRPRNQSGYSRGLNTPVRVGLGRVTEDSTAHRERRNGRKLHERRGLYRSNSSLELESVEQRTDEERQGRLGLIAGAPLRRDYGSASSLDMIGASVRDDNLLRALQDYRNENTGHQSVHHHTHLKATHAHSVPPMREFRTGRPEKLQPEPTALSSHDKLPNGGLLVEDDIDVPLSPRLKKSQKQKDKKPRVKSVVGEASGGLFKKLRGAKSDENNSSKSLESPDDVDPSVKTNDRQKRKAMVHYDCQSIGVNLYDVIRRRNSLDRRKNTTTGASAASAAPGVRSVPGPSEGNALLGLEESDNGDGKSSDLVLACAYFRNELGGEEERSIALNRATAQKRVQQLLGNRHADTAAMMRHPVCNGIAVLDTAPSSGHKVPDTTLLSHNGLVIEHVDHGAFYYRSFFHAFEHQNCFGIDDNLGPVAVSFKREKLDDYSGSSSGKAETANSGALFQYRVIVRTSELSTLRCCVLEDSIPSSSRLSSTRGIPAKDVLEFVSPEIQLSALKLALPAQKTADQLLKLDEQGITRTYKLGIMYCKAGQSTEEEMYNNELAGPALEEFLDCIGHRVRLQGFDKYRGGLDNKTDSTGKYSLYTEFNNYEIMFHVSTMLPYTPNNRQQLLRKRHVGNDIVTIVFQEPGALPFTPKTVRSHFQHVFIVVRCHNPNTDHVRYSLAVSRSKDVPPFGPPIPDGAMFPKSADFAEFLLTKAINAENAAHKCEKFRAMATRTRQEYLKDLATNYVTTTLVDSGSKLSKFSLGSGRKKERMRIRSVPDIYARGALVWNVQAEDFGQSEVLNSLLGVAAETVVLVDEVTREVIFTVPCRAVIGWTSQSNSLRIYYNRGECLALQTVPLVDGDEITEIVNRLSVVTRGCETEEMTLRRNGMGQLGFHLHYEGIVADVEPHGFAWQAGLRQGARLVEICKVATATLTHDQMIDLLRTSVTVKVIVIAPHDDGTPRRGVEEIPSGSPIAALYVDTSPSRHDDQSSTSSHSTVRASHSYPSAHLRTDKDGHSRVTATNSANYLDIRAVTADMEARGYHNSPNHPMHIAHMKDESRDSAGSRSSGHGSLDGQGSENFAARTDTMSSEGFVSGDDRHGRHAPKDNTHSNKDSEWTGQVTIYPAYSRDTNTASPPSPKPPERWARSAYLESARSAMSAISPGKSASNTNLHGYGIPPEKPPRAEHVAHSASNLSDLSSSHSGSSVKHRSEYDGRAMNNSPSTRRHTHTAGSGDRGSRRNLQKQYLDVSPGSNTSPSPQSSSNFKRSPPGAALVGGSNTNVASSSEDLANRLRPGVSNSTKMTPTRANFQEELMRLINPDISLAELEHALNKEEPNRRRNRSPRLHRTLSDESMCSSQQHTLPRQPRSLGEAISHDVIFSSTRTPSHPPGAPSSGVSPRHPELTRQQRIESLKAQWLSPRATDEAIREEVAHDGSAPLPLPDAGGLDWNNLVHTATKAFTGDGEGATEERQMGMNRSKSDKHKTSPEPTAAQANSQSVWRKVGEEAMPGATGHQHVGHHKTTITEQLQLEREERQALEMEVQRLRNDNVRLQEESQTAAAQLRRFTEWFFNTIDQK